MSEESPVTQFKGYLANLLKEKPAEPSASAVSKSTSALQNAFRLGGQSAIAGAIVAGLRNALVGRNAGVLAPIGIFTAVGATYGMTESLVANHRQTNDPLNPASGACAAGFLLGLGARSLPMAVGTCAIMGGMAGMYNYTNGMAARNLKPTGEKHFFKPTAVVEAMKRE
ncbi:hypothetical protein GGX14DRAFT_421225, partial [Mycena pura]